MRVTPTAHVCAHTDSARLRALPRAIAPTWPPPARLTEPAPPDGTPATACRHQAATSADGGHPRARPPLHAGSTLQADRPRGRRRGATASVDEPSGRGSPTRVASLLPGPRPFFRSAARGRARD